MHYLAYLQQSYAHPNKLSEAILEYLKTVDRTLIFKDDIDGFKKQVVDCIAAINNRFPRCKPITGYWNEPWAGFKENKLKDFTLHFKNHTICTFYLYQTK
jgi:hypothetical protein